MAIGKRIKYFRIKRGMTQKQLGVLSGINSYSAEASISRYEAETRIPRDELIERMAYALNVSPFALKIPDIDTYNGVMHTLFALEDFYGLKVRSIDFGTVSKDAYHILMDAIKLGSDINVSDQ